MKGIIKKIAMLGAVAFVIGAIGSSAVLADVTISGEKDDMEVKTYFAGISTPVDNRLEDEGGRLRLSGWNLNHIGGEVTCRSDEGQALGLRDSSTELPVEAEREFEAITYGKADLYFALKIGSGMKDACASLRYGSTPVVYYGVDKSDIWIQTPSGRQTVLENYKMDVQYLFYTQIDMDAKTFDVYIDNRLCAEDISFEAEAVDNFFISSGQESVGKILLQRASGSFSLKRGYWIDENFIRGDGSILPPGWSLKDSSCNDIPAEYSPSTNVDINPGITIGGRGERETLSKKFDTQTRDFTAEFYITISEGCTNSNVWLTGNMNTVIGISADADSFYYQDADGKRVKLYDSYKKDLWYVIRAEVSFADKTCDIYVDDKLKAENVKLNENAASVDTFIASGGEDGAFNLIDIKVYPTETFEDYVPEPQQVLSDGVDVGMQYFGLWNEGKHFGWDWVNDSDFRRPLDGFYDEDSIEHWDWQIKYWVEHGIDYVAPCWYTPNNASGNVSDRAGHPFFKAKYSDKMKFALLMETAGWSGWTTDANGAETWLKNVGRQMIEYYFKDPRYYTNGGRPVVFMFGWENFLSGFTSGAQELLERLGDMCVEEGIGRPICIVNVGENYSDTTIDRVKALGADGLYHYSISGWSSYANNMNLRDLEIAEENNFGYVPTISTGFDDYAWNRTVGYRRSADQIGWELQQYKDVFLPRLQGSDTLKTPMINLATWSEWAEGHYWGPSEGYGFSLLDHVRDTLTNGGIHTDITPTEHQKDRFNNLYPWWRKTTVREVNVGESPADNAYEKYSWDFDDPNDTGWEVSAMSSAVENGILKLTANRSFVLSLTDENVDTSNVTHIRLRIKNSGSGGDVSTSFTTEFWDTAAQNRTIHTELLTRNSDSFTDFYIPVGEYPEFWRGILHGMNISFGGYESGESVEIDSVSFMALPHEDDGITVCLDEWNTDIPAKLYDGMPMMPVRNVTEKLKGQVYYEEGVGKVWIRSESGLTSFVPGSDAVEYNGETYSFPGSSIMEDGVTWVDARILELSFHKYSFWDPADNVWKVTDIAEEYEIERPNTDRKNLWSYEFDNSSGISYTAGMNGFATNDGVAEFVTSSTDPQVVMSVPTVDISEAKYISVGVKSDAAFQMQIFYTTTTAGSFNETNKFIANVKPSDSIQEVVIDTSASVGFADSLKSLRIDFGSEAGVNGGIDYIRVYGDYAFELTEDQIAEMVDSQQNNEEGIVWNFNVNTKRDGWQFSKSLANMKQMDGVLTADVIGATPFFETAQENLSVDTSEYGTVKFSLKNATASSSARIYFATNEDQSWTEEKSVVVNLAKSDDMYIAYVADLKVNPAYRGTLKAIRIEIEDMEVEGNRGEIGIDYIKLLHSNN